MDCGRSWVVWFPAFSRGYWESPCTGITAGKCLPLGLRKETVKESTGGCYLLVAELGHTVYLRGTNRANSANKLVWIHPPHPGRIYINRTNTQYLALVGLLRVYCAYYDEKLPWGVESSYSINAWHITPHICAYVNSCLWSCDNF